MSKPTVVIIAGGENSRFFPLNENTYKGAITLFGQPLIVRALDSLKQHGYQKVVIVVSPKNYEGHGLSGLVDQAQLGLDVHFVLQPEAKGMGDAVLKAREQLSDQFLVTSGYQMNLGELADQLLAKPAGNVVCATHTDEPWEYGILSLNGEYVTGIVEKPNKGEETSNYKVQTLYKLDQDFIEALLKVPESPYNFEKALDLLMKNQEVGVLQLTDGLPSLKYVWHLFEFQSLFFAGAKSETATSAKIADTAVIDDSQGPVIIGEDVAIGHCARIVGPCYLGNKVIVGDFSFVRGSSVESETTIGANTEVVRSIILSHTSLHYSYVADSIIGSHVKIGAGFLTANKRLDRAPVSVTIKGKKIDTQRKALGVLIGDTANIGIRVSTMPGVCIGTDAQVFPGVVIYRNLDHKQTLYE